MTDHSDAQRDAPNCLDCGKPVETHAMYNPPRCPVVRISWSAPADLMIWEKAGDWIDYRVFRSWRRHPVSTFRWWRANKWANSVVRRTS